MVKSLLRPALIGMTVIATGCASVPEELRDPRDPWEGYNRAMHQFNEGVDKALLKPLAELYQNVTPDPVDRGVSNFFGNLADVGSAINNLLQFKLSRSLSDVGRVMANTTIGVLGLFDVASNMGVPNYKEDFGQTLGYWGIGNGPYFVLPLLGPSTVRDTFGRVGDYYTDPLSYVRDDGWRYGLTALKVVDRRADLLGASRVLEEASLDPYAFIRDAYLQRRRNEVYDGEPPLEDEFEFEPAPVE